MPPRPLAGDSKPDRRKFLKRGIAAAPLLLTLAARPVRAQAMGSLGIYEYGTEAEDDLLDPDLEIDPPPDRWGGGKGKGKKGR
jgi:hypothetical protein